MIAYFSTRSSNGTSSLSPKKEFFLVHETAIDRVLRYSILERDKFPISKDLVIQEMIIHRLLRTRLSEDSKLLIPRRNPSSSRRQLVDYDSTRPKRDELSRNHRTRRPPHYYGTRQRGFIRPLGKKNLDYYSIQVTMGQDLHFIKGNIRLLRYSKMHLNKADDKLRKMAISRQFKRNKYYTYK